MDIEYATNNDETDVAHAIISYELDEAQKVELLSAFEALKNNSVSGKERVYKLTGLVPEYSGSRVPDTDLNGYMKWLFEQHGFVESLSTTIT